MKPGTHNPYGPDEALPELDVKGIADPMFHEEEVPVWLARLRNSDERLEQLLDSASRTERAEAEQWLTESHLGGKSLGTIRQEVTDTYNDVCDQIELMNQHDMLPKEILDTMNSWADKDGNPLPGKAGKTLWAQAGMGAGATMGVQMAAAGVPVAAVVPLTLAISLAAGVSAAGIVAGVDVLKEYHALAKLTNKAIDEIANTVKLLEDAEEPLKKYLELDEGADREPDDQS